MQHINYELISYSIKPSCCIFVKGIGFFFANSMGKNTGKSLRKNVANTAKISLIRLNNLLQMYLKLM